MKKLAVLIITLSVLIFSSLIGVERTGATVLGLEEGTYNITIDINMSPVMAEHLIMTGTITIGSTNVDSFHVKGSWFPYDCDNCAYDYSTYYDVNVFEIVHIWEPSYLRIYTTHSARYDFLSFVGQGVKYGTWTATPVIPTPEPATMLLFGLGLIGMAGLRRK